MRRAMTAEKNTDRCAPHGACELKSDRRPEFQRMVKDVAPRMGRVS